jgi:hypothetical protein
MKVIVSLHSSFYYAHCLLDGPVIYSDSSRLLSQDIFAFIFCADQQPHQKPKSPFRPTLVFLSRMACTAIQQLRRR